MRMSASLNNNHSVFASIAAQWAAHDFPIHPAGGASQVSTPIRSSRCAQASAMRAVSSSELSSAIRMRAMPSVCATTSAIQPLMSAASLRAGTIAVATGPACSAHGRSVRTARRSSSARLTTPHHNAAAVLSTANKRARLAASPDFLDIAPGCARRLVLLLGFRLKFLIFIVEVLVEVFALVVLVDDDDGFLDFGFLVALGRPSAWLGRCAVVLGRARRAFAAGSLDARAAA